MYYHLRAVTESFAQAILYAYGYCVRLLYGHAPVEPYMNLDGDSRANLPRFEIMRIAHIFIRRNRLHNLAFCILGQRLLDKFVHARPSPNHRQP